MGYNRYRKRHYNISDTKKREYAKDMENLRNDFYEKYPDWNISTMMDSCYKEYKNITIRISNHSIDNKYHNIHDGSKLYVNIKASKLNFTKVIDKKNSYSFKIFENIGFEKI